MLTWRSCRSHNEKGKGKNRYSSFWGEPHLRTTGLHLPCGITHCYLPPTQANAPRLTPAMQAGTRFTCPGGMEGWGDLVDPRPGVELVTFRSRVRRPTTAPPRQILFIYALLLADHNFQSSTIGYLSNSWASCGYIDYYYVLLSSNIVWCPAVGKVKYKQIGPSISSWLLVLLLQTEARPRPNVWGRDRGRGQNFGFEATLASRT